MDLFDDRLMRERPWPWLRMLIEGLLSVRSRTRWETLGPDGQKKIAEAMGQGANVPPWL